ncbi:MAG: CvpA family protein, partial [Rhodospirillales bacterium]
VGTISKEAAVMDNLPVVDIAIAVVLILSALFAFARGFVHEILSMAGWIGAIFAAIYGFPYLKPYARDLIGIELVADLAAGLVIFIVTLIVLSIVTRTISSQVQDSALNALDRALGFLFGLVRGAIVVCLVYVLVEVVVPRDEQPGWLREAKAMPLVERGALVLRALVPQDTMNASEKAAEEARRRTEDAIETQRMIRGLIAPEPKAEPKAAQEGYEADQRRGIERLIDGSSGTTADTVTTGPGDNR